MAQSVLPCALLLTSSATGSGIRFPQFQSIGEEAESQSWRNLIRTQNNQNKAHVSYPNLWLFAACIVRPQHRSWARTLGRAHCSQWERVGLREGLQSCVSGQKALENHLTKHD